MDLLEFLKKGQFLEDHALLFLASQIKKEHSNKHLLSCFIMVLMVRFLKPKLLKQHKTDIEQ